MKRIMSLALMGFVTQSMLANDWPVHLQEPIENFKKVNEQVGADICQCSKKASNITFDLSVVAGIGLAFWMNKFPESASKQAALGLIGGTLMGIPFSALAFMYTAKREFNKNIPALLENIQTLMKFCKTDEERERVRMMIKQNLEEQIVKS